MELLYNKNTVTIGWLLKLVIFILTKISFYKSFVYEFDEEGRIMQKAKTKFNKIKIPLTAMKQKYQ